MRLVTFSLGGRIGVGIRRDGAILDTGYTDMHDLIRDGSEGLQRAAAAADAGSLIGDARLLAPIVPGKMLCSGVNYASHGDEAVDIALPSEPFFFSKLPSS